MARQRAHSAGLSNATFQVAELAEMTVDAPVDALIGRMILMYLGDPAVVLRRLASLVKPGGIVAFEEIDIEGAKAEPRCATFETALERITQTFKRARIDLRTSLKLGPIFREAGLPAPEMLQGARVERGPTSRIYAQIAEVTRSLLPLMERTGVATAAEVDVDTLAARIRDEVVAADASVVTPPLIGAWTRKA